MPAPRVSRSGRRGRSRRLADDDDGTELGDFDLEGEPAERAIGRRALEYEKPENERTTLAVVVLLFVLVMGLLVATVSMEHAAALASKAKAAVAGATEPTAVAATVAATVPAAAGAAASAGAPVGAALQSSPPPPPPPPRARPPRAPRCRELLGSRTSTNALLGSHFCAHFHGDAESCAAHFYRHANGSYSLCQYGVGGAARVGVAGADIGGPDECRPRRAFECVDDKTKESHVAGWAGPPGSTPCTPKPSANDYAFEDCQEWCTKGGKTAAAASTCTYCKCRACAICRG